MNDGGIKKHPSKYHGKKYHRQIQLNPQELRTVAWEVRSESRFADRKSESVSDDYIGARRRSIKSQLQVLQIRTLNRASSSWRCAATLRLPTMALKLRTALGAKLWTPNFGNVAVALLYAQRVHAHCRYPQSTGDSSQAQWSMTLAIMWHTLQPYRQSLVACSSCWKFFWKVLFEKGSCSPKVPDRTPTIGIQAKILD